MKVEGLKRKVCHLYSLNKRKLECDDILGLFALADNTKCLFPEFVAANLKRVPTVVPGDVDIYAMAATIASLMSQVGEMAKRMDELTKDKGIYVARLEACESVTKPAEPVVQASVPQLNATWALFAATTMLHTQLHATTTAA
jgi:hypothetical protein